MAAGTPGASAGDERLAGRRLLVFFAHPDDEAYSTAGTMAICVAGGARVTLVCATRGEQGIARMAQRGSALAALRSRELSRACEILGVQPPLFLGLPDGELARQDANPVVDRLVELISQERPHVVITLGRDGAYGHLDHLACTTWLDEALQRLGSCRPRLLHVAFPARLMRPIWSALRRARGTQLLADLPAEAFGIPEHGADLRVALGAAAEQKLAAIAAHRSQLPSADPRGFLWPGLVDRLLEEEWFTLAGPGEIPPGASDPFAGL